MRFAQIDENNLVLQVVVSDSLEWVEKNIGGMWVETLKDGTQFKYAGVGFTYDAERDNFIPPQPFPSWVLVEESLTWEAPIPFPDTEGSFVWDEQAGDWVAVETPEA